ncbi:MAG: DegQ family serine endoprotease [Alphaproteobacteria bacterium]|nr:DegQ family serine endoprotease [Alphaproteobacteria bacterium]
MKRAKLNVLFVLGFIGMIAASPAASMARSGPTGFADLAEKLLPAVVNISTTQTITAGDDLQDFQDLQIPPGSPFEEFFKDFLEKQGKNPGGKAHKRKATSLGSGFIVDPTGYIVTNYHVIQDADEINVILQDDTNLAATVVGRDKKTNLALLKVTSKKPLPAISWGDSDKIRVGDWIIAIGNPYGLGGTVTAGIISARARDINSGPYDDYLQTDAPINRGNSGGPMFNMDGDVIGVNTAIFSPSGGSIGIGFAVPASMAKGVIEQLKSSGHVRRGWLGVRIQTVTQEIADSLGMAKAHGALVSSVTPDGPAAKSHVEPGDVIVSFDGKEVTEMHRLPRLVAETPVDKTVPMTVIRKGKEVSLQVKVAELETHEEAQEQQAGDEESRPSPLSAEKVSELDIKVAPITEAARKRYDLDKGSTGVVVVDVSSDGMAADYGIQPGDIISEASQQDIKTPKDLMEAVKLAKKDSKPVLLLVDRKGDLRFVAINLNKKTSKDKGKDKDKDKDKE